MKKSLWCIVLLSIISLGWGFLAHMEINRYAVYTLPAEMQGFYKKYIDFISENAVTPDRRKYVFDDEAPRHFIDLDKYPTVIKYKHWPKALEHYTLDTLTKYGIVPWHVQKVKYLLTKAFVEKNTNKILRLSADMGHYIADAHVPLHTSSNYNGQKTGQEGIHSFWETRLTELYSKTYRLNVGKANYIPNTQEAIWKAVFKTNKSLDSVLRFERQLNKKYTTEKKYVTERRNGKKVQVYSEEYSKAYHKALNGMVERQMRAAIKMTGDFWYTCWVDAGQPNLSKLKEPVWEKEEWEKVIPVKKLPVDGGD